MKAVLFINPIFNVGLEVNVDKDEGGKKTGVAELEDIMSKDELLQGMEKVDREIAQVKQQINNLKKVQVSVYCYLMYSTVEIHSNLKLPDDGRWTSCS